MRDRYRHTTDQIPESFLTRLRLDMGSLVWPTQCIGCEAPNRDLCATCRGVFRQSHTSHHLIPPHGIRGEWLASGPYTGVRRDLIVQLKFQGGTGVARELGKSLAIPLETLMLSKQTHTPPLIVPMPSRPTRVRERGFRHLELVIPHAIEAVHRRSQVPLTRSLKRHYKRGWRILATTSGRTGQVGLDPIARQRNAARLRICGREPLAGREVILIDDIVTTGATLAAAERLLTRHGAHIRGAATLAAAVLRNQNETIESQTRVPPERRVKFD